MLSQLIGLVSICFLPVEFKRTLGILFLRRGCRVFNAGKQLGHVFKKGLHVDADLGASLDELDFELLCFCSALLGRDFALISIIDFISYQENDQVVAPDLARLINPAINIFKRLALSDVVADDGHRTVVDVGRNEGAETFLPCSVPQLQSNHLVVNLDGLIEEVNADRRLPTIG